MPICTYLSDNDYTEPTSDDELNSLLAEVCQKTGDDWRIRESVFEVRRLFRKPLIVKRYALFNHVTGPDFQFINFYRPDRSGDYLSCPNIENEAGYVAAYLYGVLGALEYQKARERP